MPTRFTSAFKYVVLLLAMAAEMGLLVAAGLAEDDHAAGHTVSTSSAP